jgi:hypothetical protein
MIYPLNLSDEFITELFTRARELGLLEARQRKLDEAERRRRAEEITKAQAAFFKTPAGQARIAYECGDHVFQYSIDVMSQQAIIVAMVGSTTSQRTADPTAILNSVCHEGWELVSGSFVFVEQGQQSRDKFMASGQNVAIKGTTVGYYLFRRCEGNRRDPLPEPWKELPAVEAVGREAAEQPENGQQRKPESGGFYI